MSKLLLRLSADDSISSWRPSRATNVLLLAFWGQQALYRAISLKPAPMKTLATKPSFEDHPVLTPPFSEAPESVSGFFCRK